MIKLEQLISSGASALLINLISMALKFGVNLVLAWFLLPDMFGIAAIVTSIVTGMVLLSDVGINDSIIRHDRGEDRLFCATAWITQAGRGVLLYAVVYSLAPFIADFYQLPELRDYLRFAGLALPIQGLKSVYLIVLQRRMQPLPELWVELAAQATAALVMVTLVTQWPTVWVLISAHIVIALVEVIGSHLLTPRDFYRFSFSPRFFREILNFGKWIYIGTLASFLLLNIDKLLLGKIESFGTLGIYQVATAFSMISYSLALSLLDRLIYPALAHSARSSKAQLVASIRQLKRVIFPTVTAMQLLVFLVAPYFFSLLYPASFHDAAWMGQMLAVLVWIMLTADFQGTILVAHNRPKLFAVVLLATAVLRPLLALLGFYFGGGLQGFIGGMMLGAGFGVVAYRQLLRKEIGDTGGYEFRLGALGLATMAVSLLLSRLGTISQLGTVLVNTALGLVIGFAFLWSIRQTLTASQEA